MIQRTASSRAAEPEWLVAIPARGWVALVNRPGAKEGQPRISYIPVVGWADTGEALIVDKREGRLGRVSDNPQFMRLEQSQRRAETRQDEGEPEGTDDV